MRKKIIYGLGILLAIIVITVVAFVGPYFMRVDFFEASPENGYHAGFYLYVSPAAKKMAKAGESITLLIQPNNSGNSDDPSYHENDAWWMGFGRHSLANELGVALLVPAFVRPSIDWHIYSHALDRDVFTTDREDLYRVDLQLIAMVDKARNSLSEQGYETAEQFLIQGYSASGMFANRFATLHPEKVLAVAAGSPGGWPILPISTFRGNNLPYPIGTADFEQLSGDTFNTVTYQAMPQLIVMGDLDDNDALDFTDGWEEESAHFVNVHFGDTPLTRWPKAEVLYQSAGANAQFVLVKDIGHDRKSLQSYTTDFFKKVLGKE